MFNLFKKKKYIIPKDLSFKKMSPRLNPANLIKIKTKSCVCGFDGPLLYSKNKIDTMGDSDEYLKFINGKYTSICPQCGILRIK